MRSVCLALILCNVLYFTWSQFIDLQPGEFVMSEPSAPQTIVLASERPEQSAIASVGSSEPEDDLEAAEGCTTVGPFPSMSEATRAAATLMAAEFEVSQRVEQGELWAGYWVHVVELATPGAAERAIALLRERGVTDVFLMPDDTAPVLSLGVFVDPERAQRRAAIARELGLNVRIVDRKRAGSVYWIDAVPRSAGQALDPSMFPPEPGKIVRIELRPCPQS